MYIDLNSRKDIKEILDYAKSLTTHFWVDEKGSKKHPDIQQRHTSELTIDEAYNLMKDTQCLWAAHFRDMKGNMDDDYWDFGGTTIERIEYGELFIWIQLSKEEANKVIKKFNLK